jgi:hypothetical protein
VPRSTWKTVGVEAPEWLVVSKRRYRRFEAVVSPPSGTFRYFSDIPTYPANLCPIWCGGTVSLSKEAQLILHNEYEGRKRFFAKLGRPLPEPADPVQRILPAYSSVCRSQPLVSTIRRQLRRRRRRGYIISTSAPGKAGCFPSIVMGRTSRFSYKVST